MSPALRDEIKSRVLLQQNVKLSDNDPVFSYLIANDEVLASFSRPIFQAIEELPGALEESVQTIATAVEASEKAANDLQIQTQGALQGIAKVELESAHRAMKDTIQDAATSVLNDALQGASKQITELERRFKALGGGWSGARSVTVTTCLAVSLMVVIAISSVGGFALYHSAQEHSRAAAYWHDQAKKAGRG